MEESKESREPRQREKITLDTVIPPLPSKAERLPPPDEDKYQRELKSLEGKATRLREKKKGVHDQIKVKKEGGKMDNAEQSVKEFIGAKVMSRKELHASRNKLRDELDILKKDFYSMIEEQKKIRPKIKIFDKDATEKQIENIQRRIDNTTLTLQEEKKLISELSMLTSSVPLISQHEIRAKKIDESKARQEVIKAQIAELTKEIDHTSGIIEETAGKAKSGKDQLKEELPIMFEETKKIQKEIEAIEEEKKKLFEDFREANFAYKKQQNQIKQIEFITKMKTKLIEQEERRKKQEEQDKLDEQNKPHPYANEILSCETFIAFLNKFIPKESAEVHVEEEKKNDAFLPDKSVLNAKETEEWFGAQNKKQKKKRVKKQKKNEVLLISPPIDLLNFFSYYGLKVPTTGEDAKIAIEELTKKKKHWEGLEVRVSDNNEEEKGDKNSAGEGKNIDLSFNPVNFPAPEECKVTENYGIFKDEGPLPAPSADIRGKRGRRRYK